VSSDCKSGPREILAPETDFKLQIKKPEITLYGVLLPVFDGKLKRADEPLTKEEKIWIETLVELLKKDNQCGKFKLNMLKRIDEFSIENVVKQWEKYYIILNK